MTFSVVMFLFFFKDNRAAERRGAAKTGSQRAVPADLHHWDPLQEAQPAGGTAPEPSENTPAAAGCKCSHKVFFSPDVQ